MAETENLLLLDERLGYFSNHSVNVMAFDDIYPEGHQSGVSILMHGRRIATCGDVRFEPTPGQWQPVPKQLRRTVDGADHTITTTLRYPDEERDLRGGNPMIYPDLELVYTVTVRADGDSVIVSVDLDRPLPDGFENRLCFNLELFPGAMFDRPYIMDGRGGIFPRQPNSPLDRRESLLERSGHRPHDNSDRPYADRDRLLGDRRSYNPIAADEWIAAPYAEGRTLTVCPDDPLTRLTVRCLTEETCLQLYDGRMNHNNGWFVISSPIPEGKTQGALCWRITPNAVPGWRSPTVVQVSQVGYHPAQRKVAVLETDPLDEAVDGAVLYRIGSDGEEAVGEYPAVRWGDFLRYRYYHVDFTGVRGEGLYRLSANGATSSIFRISSTVYDRGVWQPVLEYFLPVQMCHMRVQEKYRVWHGLCHMDDARMAPLWLNHFDSYVQGRSALGRYQPGQHVPGLDRGGWHDAGDYDLRVESQSGEVYVLALAYEEFGVDLDTATVDQEKRGCCRSTKILICSLLRIQKKKKLYLRRELIYAEEKHIP